MTNEITSIYANIKSKIIDRISDFKHIWENGSKEDIFAELVFCLLTPQSKAFSCWKCVTILREKDLLLKGDAEILQKEIKGYARFHNTKAQRIVEVREKFNHNGIPDIKEHIKSLERTFDKREWLVKNIKGYGYKEASHFLRNIGFGDDIAILDRHIYKNLKLSGVIDEIPKSVTPKKYFEIEKKMLVFSKQIKIPMSHLDFVLWYKEAGEVFK
jgi:N-glycosylase/DNA lyase